MSLRTLLALILVAGLVEVGEGSWYWPFGDDEGTSERRKPRLSEIMEPASLLIDEASDLAADRKVDDAVAKYREALAKLDEIEKDNPDRADKPEFATLRTKKAYVQAAIDSLLLSQAQSNAKVVAVSDTEALEKKLEAERKAKKDKAEGKTEEKQNAEKPKEEKPKAEKPKAEKPKAENPKIDLSAKPGGVKSLNVEAMRKAEAGEFSAAEASLDKAIKLYPRSYYAYYNMAWLILQSNPDNISGARRFYETGRTFGGPRDRVLEKQILK